MLNVVLGRTGTGKTTYIREKICEKVRQGKDVIFIVPEQFSFESERKLLEMLGPALAIKAEVLSFTRLANEVFREFGGKSGRTITDTGRAILMSLALENLSDELKLYGKYSKKVDMIEMLVETLNEFKTSSINSDSLSKILNDVEDKTLANKLHDLSLIMQAYEGLVSQKFIDDKDTLTQLANVLKSNNFFEDKIVFIDAFKGFTKQEFDIIKYMINDSEEVYATFCIDETDDEEDGMGLFSFIINTYNKFIKIAKENNVKVVIDKILDDKVRYKNDELKHIESEIFKLETKKLEAKTDVVTVCCAKTSVNECDYVGASIKKLLREKNYRCREIAVIARNIEQYKCLIKTSFDKYEIPYFEDARRSIDTQPLMMFVRYMCEILTNNSTNSIFNYLRTSLTSLKSEEIDILENYVFVWNIKASEWNEQWENNPRGFSEVFSEDDVLLLKKINEIRKSVIEPLMTLKENLVDKNGCEITKIIFEFLISISVPENLKKLAMDIEQNGNADLAYEQDRTWGILVGILEQMAIALEGENKIDIKKYSLLLDLAIALEDIGDIPQGIDEISIGSADRIRTASPRAVFIIGANEGVFPQIPTFGGVLTELDRRLLQSKGLEVLGDLDEVLSEEKFIAYSCLCSSSEKLFISYPKADLLGKELIQSTLVNQVLEIMPNCEYIRTEMLADDFWIESDLSAFEWLASNYCDKSDFANSLRKRFERNEEYKDKLASVERILKYNPNKISNPQNAKMLFPDNMYISPSRVESYYKCPFSYFCRYGLKIEKIKPAKLDTLQTGSMIHYVLEKIIPKFASETIGEYLQIEKMVEEILDEYLESFLGGKKGKTARFFYLLSRAAKTIAQFLFIIKEELAQSEFKPTDFELVIDNDGDVMPYKIELDDGSFVKVRGKVDRVDVMKIEEKSYIRIVDYKSSKKKLLISDVLNGINLQMLLYLKAILTNANSKYNTMAPAGVLYMQVKSPTASLARNAKDEEIENEKKKNLKMDGLIVADPRIIRGMEEKANGVYIPARIDDDNVCKGDIIFNNQLNILFDKINDLVKDMATDLKDGKIPAFPLESNKNLQCKYCDYDAICDFNNNFSYKTILQKNNTKMLEELEEGEN